jgi:hypothetical protein
MYAFKARVYLMQGEIDQAEEVLEYLRKIKPDINLVPYFLCTYYLTQMIFDIQKLEKAITGGNRSEIAMYRKRALTALKWWDKGIKEGERLGARLELSRTFWEVGRRLSEENSRFPNLGGISAKQYQDKARSMFLEMNLEWDLKKFDG